MKPEDATRKQIEMYRAMTGEQRLQIALGLHELACGLARENIRDQNPGASDEQVEELLKARLRLVYAK